MAESLFSHSVTPLRVRTGRAAQAANRLMRSCMFCLRLCGVNRIDGERGFCGRDDKPTVFFQGVVGGGEAELVPSYEVRLAGCNLRCAYCESGPASQCGEGCEPFDLERIASEIAACADRIRSVTILGGEPTVHLDAALAVASVTPSDLPFVFNSNGTASRESLALLRDSVDVFLPDFKFGSDACAGAIAGDDKYVTRARENLLWASRHSRLIVRHLLLPGHRECCYLPILEWMREHLPGVPLSLMEGYVPEFRAREHAGLNRTLTPEEAAQARADAAERGIELVPWALADCDAATGDEQEHAMWIGPDGRVHVQTESTELACLIRDALGTLNLSPSEADRMKEPEEE